MLGYIIFEFLQIAFIVKIYVDKAVNYENIFITVFILTGNSSNIAHGEGIHGMNFICMYLHIHIQFIYVLFKRNGY